MAHHRPAPQRTLPLYDLPLTRGITIINPSDYLSPHEDTKALLSRLRVTASRLRRLKGVNLRIFKDLPRAASLRKRKAKTSTPLRPLIYVIRLADCEPLRPALSRPHRSKP